MRLVQNQKKILIQVWVIFHSTENTFKELRQLQEKSNKKVWNPTSSSSLFVKCSNWFAHWKKELSFFVPLSNEKQTNKNQHDNVAHLRFLLFDNDAPSHRERQNAHGCVCTKQNKKRTHTQQNWTRAAHCFVQKKNKKDNFFLSEFFSKKKKESKQCSHFIPGPFSWGTVFAGNVLGSHAMGLVLLLHCQCCCFLWLERIFL